MSQGTYVKESGNLLHISQGTYLVAVERVIRDASAGRVYTLHAASCHSANSLYGSVFNRFAMSRSPVSPLSGFSSAESWENLVVNNDVH